MRCVQDLMISRKFVDVAEKVRLRQGVETQPWFIEEKHKVSRAPGLLGDAVKPHQKTEEPDKSLAALVKRHADAVPLIADANVEIAAIVEWWLIVGIGFDVELHVQRFVLGPKLKDLICDRVRDSFQASLAL